MLDLSQDILKSFRQHATSFLLLTFRAACSVSSEIYVANNTEVEVKAYDALPLVALVSPPRIPA
jgi:hypothetical protein